MDYEASLQLMRAFSTICLAILDSRCSFVVLKYLEYLSIESLRAMTYVKARSLSEAFDRPLQ